MSLYSSKTLNTDFSNCKISQNCLKNNNIFIFVYALTFLITIYIMWPGILRPDAMSQLSQALSNNYSDHHPPIMGFVWSFLNKIHHGPGLMLSLHYSLYWLGLYFFAKATNYFKTFLIIGLLPPMLIFQAFVLKDIAFANSYLFAFAVFFYTYTNNKKIINLLLTIIAFTVLFYGTAAKYQAIAPLFFVSVYLVNAFCDFKWIGKSIASIAFFLITVFLVNTFNNNVASQSHSWQYVKLYDLSGISVLNNNDSYIPKAGKNNEHYSFEALKKNFSYKRVDDLVFETDSALKKGATQKEREEILNAWKICILNNFYDYLKHRFLIFKEQILVSVIKKPQEVKGETSNIFIKILKTLDDFGLLPILSFFTSALCYFILQIFIIIFCFMKIIIKNNHKAEEDNKIYKLIMLQNLAGISLIVMLFFCSMASEARYLYLNTILVITSIPLLFLKVDKTSKNNKCFQINYLEKKCF